MDAKGCLTTPRHSPENYSTKRKGFGPALVARVGWLFGEGGCQRGAGKI